MTDAEIKKYVVATEKFEAFGATHTGEVWAKLLELTPNLFFYYVITRGLTIEELYEIKGIVYSEPKKGYRMRETSETVGRILAESGYQTMNLEVCRIPGQQAHSVALDGDPIGKYFYKEGRLVLANGGGLYLSKLGSHEIRLVRTANGWDWHPKTKQAMQNLIEGVRRT